MGRNILQNVSNSGIPRPWRDVIEVDFEVDGEENIVQETNPMTEVIYSLLDRGVDALEEILGRVREPASIAMERLDREIQDRVTQRVQASAKSLLQNVIFSIAPIVVLIGLDRLI